MDLATAVMRNEQVPNLALFQKNMAAFVHDLPQDSLANVDGDSNHVRVQVLTPAGTLDRDKQLGVVRELTDIVPAAARDPTLVDRTWVLIYESAEGGWGINGRANTEADTIAAARAEIAAAKGAWAFDRPGTFGVSSRLGAGQMENAAVCVKCHRYSGGILRKRRHF